MLDNNPTKHTHTVANFHICSSPPRNWLSEINKPDRWCVHDLWTQQTPRQPNKSKNSTIIFKTVELQPCIMNQCFSLETHWRAVYIHSRIQLQIQVLISKQNIRYGSQRLTLTKLGEVESWTTKTEDPVTNHRVHHHYWCTLTMAFLRCAWTTNLIHEEWFSEQAKTDQKFKRTFNQWPDPNPPPSQVHSVITMVMNKILAQPKY